MKSRLSTSLACALLLACSTMPAFAADAPKAAPVAAPAPKEPTVAELKAQVAQLQDQLAGAVTEGQVLRQQRIEADDRAAAYAAQAVRLSTPRAPSAETKTAK